MVRLRDSWPSVYPQPQPSGIPADPFSRSPYHRLLLGVVGWELFLIFDRAINRFNRRLKAGESWSEVGTCGSGGDHLLGHGPPLAHKALARFAQCLNILLGHSCSPSPERGSR